MRSILFADAQQGQALRRRSCRFSFITSAAASYCVPSLFGYEMHGKKGTTSTICGQAISEILEQAKAATRAAPPRTARHCEPHAPDGFARLRTRGLSLALFQSSLSIVGSPIPRCRSSRRWTAPSAPASPAPERRLLCERIDHYNVVSTVRTRDHAYTAKSGSRSTSAARTTRQKRKRLR